MASVMIRQTEPNTMRKARSDLNAEIATEIRRDKERTLQYDQLLQKSLKEQQIKLASWLAKREISFSRSNPHSGLKINDVSLTYCTTKINFLGSVSCDFTGTLKLTINSEQTVKHVSRYLEGGWLRYLGGGWLEVVKNLEVCFPVRDVCNLPYSGEVGPPIKVLKRLRVYPAPQETANGLEFKILLNVKLISYGEPCDSF